MSESDQRRNVVRALKGLHAIPVENGGVHPGTPDVAYIGGWIELKWLRNWPKSETVDVKIEHFTRQQRNWLRRHQRLGGSSWLLLQVRREWLLFTGRDAAEYVGNVTRETLYKVCRARWTLGLNNKELARCLTMDWASWNGSPMVNGCWSIVDDEGRLRERRLGVTE